MTITIFHNPGCGTSRNVLQALRDGGHAPQVVEYLKAGWTQTQLADLFAKMGVTARQMLRTRGDLAGELGLTDPAVGETAILKAMVAHPVLVERPIVITPKGVFLCRPADRLAAAL
jgi:arsenate reductase